MALDLKYSVRKKNRQRRKKRNKKRKKKKRGKIAYKKRKKKRKIIKEKLKKQQLANLLSQSRIRLLALFAMKLCLFLWLFNPVTIDSVEDASPNLSTAKKILVFNVAKKSPLQFEMQPLPAL